jgi:uncharacterized protein YndB with AHSA1/START domain
MMKIVVSIDIKASQERVWSWLGDPERAKTWMTSVTHTEYVERTPDLVGSTFREYVEEEGRGTWLEGQIVEYEPDRRMTFQLEGDYNAVEVVFTLDELNGVTRVTQTADVRFKGLMRLTSLFLGRTIKENITRQSQSEFDALKALCEAGEPEDNPADRQ